MCIKKCNFKRNDRNLKGRNNLRAASSSSSFYFPSRELRRNCGIALGNQIDASISHLRSFAPYSTGRGREGGRAGENPPSFLLATLCLRINKSHGPRPKKPFLNSICLPRLLCRRDGDSITLARLYLSLCGVEFISFIFSSLLLTHII